MKNRFPLTETIVERFFDGTQKKSKHFVIFKLDFFISVKRVMFRSWVMFCVRI